MMGRRFQQFAALDSVCCGSFLGLFWCCASARRPSVLHTRLFLIFLEPGSPDQAPANPPIGTCRGIVARLGGGTFSLRCHVVEGGGSTQGLFPKNGAPAGEGSAAVAPAPPVAPSPLWFRRRCLGKVQTLRLYHRHLGAFLWRSVVTWGGEVDRSG